MPRKVTHHTPHTIRTPRVPIRWTKEICDDFDQAFKKCIEKEHYLSTQNFFTTKIFDEMQPHPGLSAGAVKRFYIRIRTEYISSVNGPNIISPGYNKRKINAIYEYWVKHREKFTVAKKTGPVRVERVESKHIPISNDEIEYVGSILDELIDPSSPLNSAEDIIWPQHSHI